MPVTSRAAFSWLRPESTARNPEYHGYLQRMWPDKGLCFHLPSYLTEQLGTCIIKQMVDQLLALNPGNDALIYEIKVVLYKFIKDNDYKGKSYCCKMWYKISTLHLCYFHTWNGVMLCLIDCCGGCYIKTTM